ncbi:biofilm master transcriptional regulator CsgD [Rouxiella sp. T17]|uniref:biofilm master transcriptional regulator CsgD n=1 Tax=Rouxiella sp. T17 TaxID=3085684 RepID=UPI002FC6C0CD
MTIETFQSNTQKTPQSNKVLLLVTKPSLQSSALLLQLSYKLGINTKLHHINKPLDEPVSDELLVIFDIAQADKKMTSHWQTTLSQYRTRVKTLLLNAPEDYPFYEIERWPTISAVFYPSTGETQLTDGISSVLRDECYFSPRFTRYLVNQSGQQRYFNHQQNGITQRESEILNKLRMGASNHEIAQLLFISENTVKTHLYNLFKKISVKNRTQAVSWANENLRR